MQSLSSSVSTTSNQLAFELVQASQDAQFGMAGVANQIPLIAEQFGRLKSETGSTTGALGELLSTFTGPTGLLAIGTLGLQALPSIIQFFDSMGGAADEAETKVEDLRSAANQLITGFRRELPEFEITDIDAAEQSVAGMEAAVDARRQLIEDAEDFQGLSPTEVQLFRGAEASDFQDPEMQLRAQEAAPLIERFGNIDDLDAFIDRQERILRNEQAVAQALRSQIDPRRRQLRLLREIREAQGVRLVQDDEESFEWPEPRDLQQVDTVEPAGSEFQPYDLQGMIENVDLEPVTTGAEQAGQEVQNSVNQNLAQSIRLASQLGATMIQAAQGTDKEWNQVLGSILSSIGAIVGIANPVAGAAIAGGGTLLQSFDEGGPTGGREGDVAGFVHGQEYVFSAEATKGNVGALTELHELMRGGISLDRVYEMSGLPGYASGGYVSAMTQPVVSSSTSSGAGSSAEQVAQAAADRAARQTAERVADALAERPNIMYVGRRGSKDIVEAGQEEIDRKDSGL